MLELSVRVGRMVRVTNGSKIPLFLSAVAVAILAVVILYASSAMISDHQDDGAHGQFSIVFSGDPTIVTRPTPGVTEYTYFPTDTVEYYPDGFDSDTMNISDNHIQTNAGTYDVTVSLKDPVNYCWDDMSTADLHFQFTIKPFPYTRPTAGTSVFTYDGTVKVYVPDGYNSSIMALSNNMRTTVGSQTASVDITNSNYVWSTGNPTETLYFEFTVNKAVIADPSAGSKTYNCDPQISSITDVPGVYTVTENEGGTDAGSYDVVVLMDSDYYINHRWTSTDQQEITIQFVIGKASISVITTDFNPVYNSSVQAPTVSDLHYDQYKTGPDSSKVQISAPTTGGIDAGTHNVNVKVQGDLNFIDCSLSVSYVIDKMTIATPQADERTFEYDGTEQEYCPQNLDVGHTLIDNNLRIDAGSQTVTVFLTDEANLQWEDETSDPLDFLFTILPKSLERPTASEEVFTYNGTEQEYMPGLFDGETMDIFSNRHTNAGNYTVTVVLKDKNNYCWNGSSTEDLEYDFIIHKKSYAVPDAGSKTFNCVKQVSDIKGKTGEYTVTENEGGVIVAFYNVKIRLTDVMFINYEWSTSDEQEITIKFQITKATVTEITTEYKAVYTGSVQLPGTDDLNYTGFLYGPDNVTVTPVTDCISAKTQTARVTIAGDDNFVDAQIDINYPISQALITKPSPSAEVFIYDGTEKVYTPVGFDGTTMNISGNKEINAGSYTVTVKIRDKVNYLWSDKTDTDLKYGFVIGKQEIPKPSAGSKVYNCEEQVSDLQGEAGVFTVTENEGGEDVGDYPVVVRLTDDRYNNYTWAGETDQETTVFFSITKATIIKVTTDTVEKYDGNVHVLQVSDLKYTGFTKGPAEENVILTPREEIRDADSYTLDVSVKDDSNFFDFDGETVFIIVKKDIPKPTDNPDQFTYNGEIQTYTPDKFDSETMSAANNQRTDAGNQTVYVDLIDLKNYEWDDHTQSTMLFEFNIGKAKYDMSSVEFSDSKLTYNGKAQHHEIVGTLPTGHDGYAVTVEYSGSATYVNDGPVQVTATFSTESSNYFTPAEMTADITIMPRVVTVNGITAQEKVYNGGVDIILVTDSAVIENMIEGDTLAVSAAGHLTSKNCSDAQTVQIDSISLSGDSISNYKLMTDSSQRTAVAKVSPKSTQILGAKVSGKIYDGTTEAENFGTLSLSWVSIGDDVTINAGKAEFDTRHVGTGKPVRFYGYYLGGADAINYACVQPADAAADITPKTVKLINGTRSISKEFDGTTDGIKLIFGQHYSFDGIIGDDKINLIDSECVFDDPTVKATKVTITSMGIDNGNYVLENSDLTAYVSSRNITVENGPVPIEKIYDGTVSGTDIVKGVHYVLQNTIPGYDVNLKNAAYTYDSPDAGARKITFKSMSIDNINYYLMHDSLDATIYQKELHVSNGAAPITKVYDGNNRLDSLSSEQYVIKGAIEGDSVDLIDTSGVFDTATVEAKKYSFNSVDLNNQNYHVVSVELSASITKKNMWITGLSVEDKKFDDTVKATVVGSPTKEGVLKGDDVRIIDGYAEFDSPDSGLRTAYFYEYTITGNDSFNYELAEQPAPVKARITSYLGDGDTMTQLTIGGIITTIGIISLAIIIFRRII